MDPKSQLITMRSRLPNKQETGILIVGAEGTGKHELSLSILKLPVEFSLKIRTANSLPLPEDSASERPRVDFICFIINLTDRDSIQVVEKSLAMVDVKYFLGRSCLVVSGAHSQKKMSDVDQVTALAESYHLSLMFGEIKVEKDRDQLARRIFTMTEFAAGLKERITPAFIESTKI